MRGFVRVVLLCITAMSPLWAQVWSSVTGIVEDATQAQIPGLTVVAANTQTGAQTTVISNESASYNLPNLTPGTRTLRDSLAGFRPQVFENIGGNETRHFKFALQVPAQTGVEVSDDVQQSLTHSVRLVVL